MSREIKIPIGVDESIAELIELSLFEARKAMKNFPQPNYVISKVAEEAGEVVKEAIHCAEGRGDYIDLKHEMKQTMAMLIRLWIEGDEVHGLKPVKDMQDNKLNVRGK